MNLRPPAQRALRLKAPSLGRVVGLVLLGCSPSSTNRWTGAHLDGDGGAPVEASSATVVLGSGEVGFELVPEGGAVNLVAGPQGGFHVPLSLRLYGAQSRRLLMRLTTQWEGVEGTEVPPSGSASRQPANIAVRLNPVVDERGDSVLELLNWTAFLYEPQCADGQRLELFVQLYLRPLDGTVADQLVAQGSTVWSVAVDEAYRAADCEQTKSSPK